MRLLLIVAILLPFGAAAQDDIARIHFDAGQAYYNAGEYEQAITEFNAAYRISPRPLLLYNISMAYERLGDLPNAIENLDRYLREAGDDAQDRPTMERRLARMRQRAAERGGGSSEPPAEPSDPPAQPSGGGGGGTDLVGPGIGVLAGVGGAGFVLFGIAGGLTVAEDASLAERCSPDCIESDLGTLRAMAIAADVGLAVGIVGVGVGVILIAIGASSGSGERASLVPIVGPNVAGLSIAGRL